MQTHLLADPSLAFDAAAPRRVVSLVPSVTGSLSDLGLGGALVGITDYCPAPVAAGREVSRVGGPKNPRLDEILQLKPDLVIANREENDRTAVEKLAEAGVTVWLTFPLTVQAAINDLWLLANLFRSEVAMQQVDFLERGVEWARMAGASQPPLRYFCPIWQESLTGGPDWWMTFNAQTYPNDVLSIFHGENIFASRARRYPLQADLGLVQPEEPGDRDTRYPRITAQEIIQAAPELILLPDEPFAYSEEHLKRLTDQFADTPAVRAGRVYTIDGSLITWHGTRLVRALEELPGLFSL